MSSSTPDIRFGVWALTGGSWASRHHPEDPPDASWERNRRLILEAEQLGYQTTLLAQHTINPSGDENDVLEPWSASAALAALTERIEIITAIKPYLYHPVVLAKQALQIEEISGGRFAINLVNAWYRPELERSGIGFGEHDERYEYGREWLEVFTALASGRRTTFHGRHFHVEDYRLAPRDRFRERPTIYIGGESEPARALAADGADVWFINGQPPADVAALIEDLRRRPRGPGAPPLRFGLSALVIARESEDEAQAELDYAWHLKREHDMPHMQHVLGNADPKAKMFETARRNPAIGTNGGTAAGLVGSYDQVAERILRFHELGIDTFMLQFQPFEAEMRRFAHEVIPRVGRLSAIAA